MVVIAKHIDADGLDKRRVQLFVKAASQALAAGDGQTLPFHVTDDIVGFNLTEARAVFSTAGVTGNTEIQVRRVRDPFGTPVAADMLSSKIIVAAGSLQATGTVDTANDDLAQDDQIFIDIDLVSTGTAPLGLYVLLTFQQP